MAKKILVIDDNKYHCEFISAAGELFSWNCVTTLTTSAFFDNLAPDTALILLDLMMPEMDGVELLTLLAQRQCRAQIILMSGVGGHVLAATERFAQSLGLSVAGHLRKPFRLAELESIVTQTLQIAPGIISTPRPSHASNDSTAPPPEPQSLSQPAHA
jgi:CheY-like chemotaxis protein